MAPAISYNTLIAACILTVVTRYLQPMHTASATRFPRSL
jgi:hypothetical protein